MISILVDKNKKFNFEFNAQFKYLNNEIIGFKLKNDGEVKIKFSFTNRDFETMSKIIEDSSIINSVTGKPLLRSSLFTKLIVLNYIKDVQVESETYNASFQINNQNINNIHYDLIKFLAMKWLELTDGV